MQSLRLCLLVSGFLVLSCRQNRPQLETINDGLETSTRVLEGNCDTTVHALIHGSRYLTDEYWAVRWQPVAAKATLMAGQAADYLDSLQTELPGTHKIDNERIKVLFDTLLHYKQNLPLLFRSLHSEPGYNRLQQDLPGVFANLAVLPGYPVSATPDPVFRKWKDSTFDGDEMLTRIALTKLKHDLILSAYQLIQFIRREIAEFVENFTQFDAVEALSANVVGPGNKIQVTAGICQFRTELRPTITIGNRLTPLTDYGVAIAQIKAPRKPGNSSIPVRLKFNKPDGSKAWKDDTLHYQVLGPCAP
jgi:hypothetical protein